MADREAGEPIVERTMTAAPTTEQKIDILWTRAEIERVMLNFGRALDTGDWKLYRSCFAERFKVNFERLTGQPEVYVDADLWTRFAQAVTRNILRMVGTKTASCASMASGKSPVYCTLISGSLAMVDCSTSLTPN
jgi:hypothetical protein